MLARNSYNVAVKNRFAQLDSDVESDAEIEINVESQKNVKRQPAKREIVRKEKQQPEEGPRVRFSTDKKPASSTSTSKSAVPATKEIESQKAAARRQFKSGRPSSFSQNGKKHSSERRTSDRVSGTGRGREMKKKGAGGHNWGSEISEERKGLDAGVVETNASGPLGDTITDSPVKPDSVENDQGMTGKESSAQQQKEISYSAYESELRMKRQVLQQQEESTPVNVRSIDASTFEKDGLRRYEKNENDREERPRQQRIPKYNTQHDSIDNVEVFSNLGNNTVQPLFEFKRPSSNNRRGRHGTSQFTKSSQGSKQKSNKQVNNEKPIDVTDTKTFPILE